MGLRITQLCLFILMLTKDICCAEVRMDQSPPVVMKPTETVKISCQISGFTMTNYYMHWIRQKPGRTLEWIGKMNTGNNVPIYADSMKEKFTLTEDVPSSTQYLETKSLTAEDTAVYYCARAPFLAGRRDAFDYWGKGTMVTVTSGAQSAPSSIFAVSQCGGGSDGFLTLGCLTSGFSPAESLKFKWADPNGKDLTDFIQYPAVQAGGSYTSLSHVRVKASDWSTEKEFTCTAEHPAGSQTGKTTVFQEPVSQGPTINIVKVSDGKSIMCVLEDFSPKAFTVKWTEEGTTVNGLDLPAKQSKPGLYTASSILQVTEAKWKRNVEYTCEVTHNNKVHTAKQRFTAVLAVKIKGPVPKELFVNNTAVMECVVTGNNEQAVKGAIISWTAENIPNPDVKHVDIQQTGQQYTKSSILTFDQTYWFSGNNVKCSTTWNQKEISDFISIKKGAQKQPTVLIYKPDNIEDSQDVSMVCEINGSPLGDVYVMWIKGDRGPYTEGNFTSSVHKKDNSFSVFSILTVTKQEYDDPSSKFICAVKHARLENYSAPIQKATLKKDVVQSAETVLLCSEEEPSDEDEFSSLWSTALSFIFLFIFSLVYSTILSLSKIKSGVI